MYDYSDYWWRAFSYQKEKGFIPELLEHLKGVNFFNVLELGSGQGHLTKALKENFNCHITGIDIIGPNYFLDEYWQRDLSNLLFNKDFDLIVGRFILMHIKPQHIEHLLKQIKEHGKHLAFIDYNPLEPIPLMEHNFYHNIQLPFKRLSPHNVLYYA